MNNLLIQPLFSWFARKFETRPNFEAELCSNFRILLSGFLLILYSFSFAKDADNMAYKIPEVEVNPLILGASPKADWFFSGRVHNENNLYYDYFFKIQQHDQTIDLQAALVSVEEKKVILFERAIGLSTSPHQTKWQSGKLFLNYNAINNRWVLGAKNDAGVSFNFKIDLFAQKSFEFSKNLTFKPGIHVVMNKTGRLNGHLKSGHDKEEFVSENSAWLSHIWLNESQPPKLLTLLLCDFEDDQGFFTMKSMDKKTPYTFAFWRDATGKSVPVSQFLSIKNHEDTLSIDSASPKMQLRVTNLLPVTADPNQNIVMGRVRGYQSGGFCVQNEIG